MIHIKETEIIPLLKEAQTEYSQKITEGDPSKTTTVRRQMRNTQRENTESMDAWVRFNTR